MKVLMVASESFPFAKSGGLADVAFALPKMLRSMGVDIRVVIPKYGTIPESLSSKFEKTAETHVSMNWRKQYCGIYETVYDTVPFYLIDNPYYFNRESLYGHYDDGERFSFFCRSVMALIDTVDFKPDILHLNDWHTGMVSVLLSDASMKRMELAHMRTVFTIHNLKYQGVFPPEILPDLLELSLSYYDRGEVEFHRAISFMKAGIRFSHYVTTVSPSYAQEIQNPFFGEKLDGVIRDREQALFGIVNGIDYEHYDPSTDSNLAKHYDAKSSWHKRENKEALQQRLGLPVRSDVPMIAMVTRLADMKGLDLVTHVFDELVGGDVQFVVLGTGEHRYESFFKNAQERYPDKVAAVIGFDESLARQIYGGSDLFLMPSLFEPCGLGQLIALRYGSIPVVRETGGLRDTVTPYNEFSGEGNGFSFSNYNAHEMLHAIRYGLSFYYQPAVWKTIVQNAMRSDNSWHHSAEQYKSLYERLAEL